ncbi:acetyltransferase [Hahella sp. HN01]|uniref:acetyltransferase n=1 Tax=Hahella sp. HN01 TaxID=2847262 RepID=UPI001C1E9EB5|nr:acetyltransferase [Hahella sp. HN01]
MNKPVLLIGGGGHARVLMDILILSGAEVIGVLDPGFAQGTQLWRGVEVLGGDERLSDYDPSTVDLVNALGYLPGKMARNQLFAKLSSQGYCFPTLVHPHAVLSDDISLGEGCQIMAGAILQPGCVIGANTIVNTRAVIEHDCVVGPDNHIAPGAVLCGGVQTENGVFVGSHATVLPQVRIGVNALIGAGAVAAKDIPSNGKLAPPKSSLLS